MFRNLAHISAFAPLGPCDGMGGGRLLTSCREHARVSAADVLALCFSSPPPVQSHAFPLHSQ